MKYPHYDYAIIGGDARQVYLAKELVSSQKKVIHYALMPPHFHHPFLTEAQTLIEAIHFSSCVICPIPLTKNKAALNQTALPAPLSPTTLLQELQEGQCFFAGCIPEDFCKKVREKNVFVYDLMKNESFTIYNTIATAEGAICEAIQNSPQNLHHSQCAVLGYGRCGRTLTNYLKGMFCQIFVASNQEEERSVAHTISDIVGSLDDFYQHAMDFDFIFNTIPAQILTEPILSKLKPSVTILDIASKPFGVDYKAASRLNLNAIRCPGLPGKYSPSSSAKAMKKIIEENQK